MIIVLFFLFNSVYTLIFRLIKMNLFKNLIDISSENGKISEFLNLQMIFIRRKGVIGQAVTFLIF